MSIHGPALIRNQYCGQELARLYLKMNMGIKLKLIDDEAYEVVVVLKALLNLGQTGKKQKRVYATQTEGHLVSWFRVSWRSSQPRYLEELE